MTVYQRIADFHEDMTSWRQEIHQFPETSFEEEKTAAFIAAKLASWGIEVHTGLAKTGVVGILHGRGNGSRSIGLRADIDALPIEELNDLPYRSKVAGKMHACGHDGHTTMLLGAARYLAETRNFDGVVTFIFQPAEEGGGGAKVMMDEGLFERFPCDSVWGMHNDPRLPAGKIATREGAMLASADLATMIIRGKGSHAARPHEGIDPIAVGFHLYQGLQLIVSRNAHPMAPAVVSVCEFHAGNAINVIADTARMTATIRTFDPAVRAMIEARVKSLCKGIAESHDCVIDLTYDKGYPALINHKAETQFAAGVAEELCGVEGVERDGEASMGSEDFAYMLQAKPGSFVRIGQAVSDNDYGLHHPRYNFNDAILPLGASYWVRLAERALPLEGYHFQP